MHETHKDAHLVSKVDHNEGRVGHAGFLEVLAARVPVIELLSPVLVSSFRDLQKHERGRSALWKGKSKPRATA